MGKSSEDNRAAMLMAAVSVIALSVGMVSAQAESTGDKGVLIGLSKQDKHSTQIKGDSNQHKDTSSNQIKSEAIYIKLDSKQIKGQSNQHKGESNQIKLHNGQSVQQKGNSLQQKGDAHGLNPQPEPPG